MTLRTFGPMVLLLMSVSLPQSSQAGIVIGGTAQFELNNNSILFSGYSGPPGFGGPLIMERHYGSSVETVTPAQLLAGTAGLGDSITVPLSGVVTLNASVNGLAVTSPFGRARQATNLDVDFANVLATWGAGEQIGIDSILRTTVNPVFGPGVIGLGDYSLVNDAGTLTLVNNIAPAGNAFTIGNAVFQDLGNGFSVAGDLFVAKPLSDLTVGFVPIGANVGSFSMTAISAVPEPSSLALLGIASVGMSLLRRRKKRNKGELVIV